MSARHTIIYYMTSNLTFLLNIITQLLRQVCMSPCVCGFYMFALNMTYLAFCHVDNREREKGLETELKLRQKLDMVTHVYTCIYTYYIYIHGMYNVRYTHIHLACAWHLFEPLFVHI